MLLYHYVELLVVVKDTGEIEWIDGFKDIYTFDGYILGIR